MSATVTAFDGFTLDDVKANIKGNLTDYIRSIAFGKGVTYLSIAQVGSRIALSEGVLDYKDLTLNEDTVNVPLGDRDTPVLRTVVIR